MALLVGGLLVFFAVHLVPTLPDVRARMIGRLGESGYKLAFAVASVLSLVMIVWGFGEARLTAPQLWDTPEWTRHVAFLLMIPALILLAAAYIPSRIRTFAKHPMLTAIKFWALAHLIANGDLASLFLFGSFLAYAAYDRVSAKRRTALGPLGARAGGLAGDVAAIAIGLLAYVAILGFGHEHLIGVPLIGPISIPS